MNKEEQTKKIEGQKEAGSLSEGDSNERKEEKIRRTRQGVTSDRSSHVGNIGYDAKQKYTASTPVKKGTVEDIRI